MAVRRINLSVFLVYLSNVSPENTNAFVNKFLPITLVQQNQSQNRFKNLTWSLLSALRCKPKIAAHWKIYTAIYLNIVRQAKQLFTPPSLTLTNITGNELYWTATEWLNKTTTCFRCLFTSLTICFTLSVCLSACPLCVQCRYTGLANNTGGRNSHLREGIQHWSINEQLLAYRRGQKYETSTAPLNKHAIYESTRHYWWHVIRRDDGLSGDVYRWKKSGSRLVSTGVIYNITAHRQRRGGTRTCGHGSSSNILYSFKMQNQNINSTNLI